MAWSVRFDLPSASVNYHEVPLDDGFTQSGFLILFSKAYHCYAKDAPNRLFSSIQAAVSNFTKLWKTCFPPSGRGAACYSTIYSQTEENSPHTQSPVQKFLHQTQLDLSGPHNLAEQKKNKIPIVRFRLCENILVCNSERRLLQDWLFICTLGLGRLSEK